MISAGAVACVLPQIALIVPLLRHLFGGRYDLRITDNNYFAFDSNFIPITSRDLTLEDVSGTSYDVGPDNLATFTVSAGTALTSFEAKPT
jgi:hypothetical protein